MSRSVSGRVVLVIMLLVAVGVIVAVRATRKDSPTDAVMSSEGAANKDSSSAIAGAKKESQAAGAVANSPGAAPGTATSEKKPEVAPPIAPPGSACATCTAQNCIPTTDGCDRITDPTDRKLCEDLYSCFTNTEYKCVSQGDPLRCWCGKQPTTCVTANEPPKRADGPCLEKVFAAAKTRDAATVRSRFVDPSLPIGRAVRLSLCRGSFCSAECGVP